MATSGLAYWADGLSDWDELILGGVKWPGIWSVTGAGVSRKIDLKKSKGADQATLKDEGYKNAKLTATGVLHSAEQWQQLQQVLPDVHPRRQGGDRQPLQLIHPAANLLGIDSVYLTGIKVPTIDAPKGGPLTIVLDFIEWTPKPKPVKNASGQSGGGKGNQPKTLDDLDGEFEGEFENDAPLQAETGSASLNDPEEQSNGGNFA
jgi:hypothetical protein